MTPAPLCPLAIAMLARQPRRVHELARALGSDYPTAAATLRRLEEHELVRRRKLQAGAVYQITRRGSAELALQQPLWTAVVNAARRPRPSVVRSRR